ncbi:MAG TPA: amino acid permease [Steroidobacteraceae bacterium]|nr:amino acid permease [Steroidobacteraceae bacterium]
MPLQSSSANIGDGSQSACGERDAAAGLSWVQGTALYIGAVLGTGVIALPALAADMAGPASLLAWLALVLLSIPLAATFSALGARYPDAGGISTCVKLAFGARPAGVVGWCFFFAVPVGSPAAAMFAGAYVEAAVGGGAWTLMLTAFSLVLGITLINAFGVTLSGKIQVLVAGLLIAFLLTAVSTSLPHLRLQNLHPFAPHGWLAVASAAGLLVWSFAGWEAITYLAAEFRQPARDMPRAATAAVIVIGILYFAVAAATVLVLGAHASRSAAPLALLLAFGFGNQVKILAAVAALLLTAGTMNAYYAGAAKLGAALGRDGALPAWFAHGSEVGGIPRRSLLTLASLTLIVLVATIVAHVRVEALVLMTTGAFVVVYILGTAAALRLLEAGTWGRRAALLALIFDVLLLATTGWYILWSLAIAACSVIYLYITRAEPPASAR